MIINEEGHSNGYPSPQRHEFQLVQSQSSINIRLKYRCDIFEDEPVSIEKLVPDFWISNEILPQIHKSNNVTIIIERFYRLQNLKC